MTPPSTAPSIPGATRPGLPPVPRPSAGTPTQKTRTPTPADPPGHPAATTAGLREARGARRSLPGAPLPRPLDAYAGEDQHPGYGTLTITLGGGSLQPRLGTMNLSLAHRHYETFDLEWHELGDQSHLFPLMFLADPDGDITARTSSSAGPTSCTLRPVRRRRLEGRCRRVIH
ncbi:MAG: DUF3471 domain-containing protein [Streptosporangiaceae bacterium]